MWLLSLVYYLVYSAICLLCVNIAKKETGDKLTITSMFVLPYLAICTFQEFICICFTGFAMPSPIYWVINICFISVTCFVEVALTRITKLKCNIYYRKNFSGNENLPKSVFLITGVFILICVISSISMVRSIDMALLFQDDFQDEFSSSSGGNFFARLITIILAVYFLGINKSWLGYILGCLCFIPHIVVNTKGVIFIPVIAMLFMRTLLGRITNIRKLFFVLGGAGAFIFFFSYLIEYSIYDENAITDNERWFFIFEKLVAYLLSGVQEFNVNVINNVEHNPIFDNITLTPLYNLFSKFGFGESMSPVNQEIYNTFGTLPNYGIARSNVNGYIGTLFLFNGMIGGLLYHCFIISLIFSIKYIAYTRQRPFWLILYVLFLAGLFLGWFEFYFMHTFWMYFILMTIVFDFLYRLTNSSFASE